MIEIFQTMFIILLLVPCRVIFDAVLIFFQRCRKTLENGKN